MIRVLLFILSFLPAIAFAQISPSDDVFDLLGVVAYWATSIIPVLIGIIVLIVFWNLGQFILHAGDEREREKYKQFMIWSVVAMFLIVSFWGIIYAINRSFFESSMTPTTATADPYGIPV